MEAIADLHTHTKYSDGILTPEELFSMAEQAGLTAISITDHDSIQGCLIANDIKDKYNIDFIPGIEFSCYEGEKEIHMLGYNIDIENKTLHSYIEEFQKARFKRAELIINKLNKLGKYITIDEVLLKAGDAPIIRPHIASILIEKGYVRNWREAFTEYLGDGSKAYYPKAYFSIPTAIELINSCHGLSVLAHPARTIEQDLLYKIIGQGLDGIEVVHPMHDYKLEKYYHEIANQYLLISTGGSDYHGTRDYDDVNFGKFTIPYSAVESIRNRTREK
ncbi:MAG: PHP domain-containing protein [FCB group bacterium]|jgi:predicted metal-dependent phosphoesterase TrpH